MAIIPYVYNMIIDTLRILIRRDLNRLKREIASYSKEENLWIVEKDIANCAGNLALHLVGNLNAFIGAVIGNTGYVRQRDKEFSDKDVPREELLERIEKTIEVVDTALVNMDLNLLEKEYPIQVFREPTTYAHFLVHLATHLSYHLGQVNYHRRILDN